MGASLSPAISKHLKAFLYGWLPLSNAYGIFLLRPHTQSIYISTLRPMTNLSTFFVAPPYPICLYFHVAIHAQSINISHCKIYRLSIYISHYNSFPIYRLFFLCNPIPYILTFPVAEKQSGACIYHVIILSLH